MASLTGPTYEGQPTPEEQQHLAETIKNWSIGNGLAVLPPPTVIPSEVDTAGVSAIHVPVTLFPSPFPKLCFEQAKIVQKPYNELYAAVSRDVDFISQIVKE